MTSCVFLIANPSIDGVVQVLEVFRLMEQALVGAGAYLEDFRKFVHDEFGWNVLPSEFGAVRTVEGGFVTLFVDLELSLGRQVEGVVEIIGYSK